VVDDWFSSILHTSAKYFTQVQVASSAALKMMTHAVSGVERGMANGGKPVEVMGLMLGHLFPDSPQTLVVTDVFPLPVEGAETRVLADDQEVLNFMIDLGESLENTREGRFMGWYHSHPFDVGVHSHCFMSATDVSTQLGWQRAEDRNGNPWLAIVVDPLRSLAKGRPEMGAFRAYPPEYAASPNETPDGTVEVDNNASVERWGSAWDRYHTLEVKFFMSSLSSNVLSLISRNFLWMSAISTTPTLEKENRDRFAERVNGITSKLGESTKSLILGRPISSIYSGNDAQVSSDGVVFMTQAAGLKPNNEGSLSSSSTPKEQHSSAQKTGNVSEFEKTVRSGNELSVEQLQSQITQIAKHLLFAE